MYRREVISQKKKKKAEGRKFLYVEQGARTDKEWYA